jgi:protein-tyrosine phosphatase
VTTSSSASPAHLEIFLDQPVNTISDPVNFRDLGGLAVDGGTIRSGVVFRSDDICLVSAAWASDLVVNKHVTAILDLRSASEVRVTGRGPLADEEVAYHHYPLGGDVVVEGAVSIGSPEALAHWYANLIESSASMIVAALAGIGAENGATVFHCSAGKDRTGVVAACLLAILGASDEVISDDYGRTSEVLDSVIGRLAASHGISPRDSRIAAFLNQEPRPPVLTADVAVMAETVRLMASRHGSLAQFLRQRGLTDSHIQDLRARLVE